MNVTNQCVQYWISFGCAPKKLILLLFFEFIKWAKQTPKKDKLEDIIFMSFMFSQMTNSKLKKPK